jgi:GTPase
MLILAGIVTKGILCKGLQYKMGPDQSGNFKIVTAINIHCKRIEVKSATQGQYCSILLDSSVTREMTRKGMVLLDANTTPRPCRSFEVEVWSMDENVKIKYTSQPMINVSHIRQSVRIVKENSEDEEFEVFNDKTIRIVFEFMYQPEFIIEGSHFIIHENNIKLYGYVTKIIN